jgi:hypothetical protein
MCWLSAYACSRRERVIHWFPSFLFPTLVCVTSPILTLFFFEAKWKNARKVRVWMGQARVELWKLSLEATKALRLIIISKWNNSWCHFSHRTQPHVRPKKDARKHVYLCARFLMIMTPTPSAKKRKLWTQKCGESTWLCDTRTSSRCLPFIKINLPTSFRHSPIEWHRNISLRIESTFD